MKPRTVTISFELDRLRLIETALKKAERLFAFRDRHMLRSARRQITIRLMNTYQMAGEDRVFVLHTVKMGEGRKHLP